MKARVRVLGGLGVCTLAVLAGGCASVPYYCHEDRPEIVLVPVPYPVPCPDPVVIDRPAPEPPRHTPLPRTPRQPDPETRTRLKGTERGTGGPVVVSRDRKTETRGPVVPPRTR